MLEINDENQLQISKVAKLKLNNSVKAQERDYLSLRCR